jgi:hypothetical protein
VTWEKRSEETSRDLIMMIKCIDVLYCIVLYWRKESLSTGRNNRRGRWEEKWFWWNRRCLGRLLQEEAGEFQVEEAVKIEESDNDSSTTHSWIEVCRRPSRIRSSLRNSEHGNYGG